VLRIGRIELDTAAVRAFVDGKALPLSTKEFSLLRLLASRVGEPLSRSDILQDVWGTTRHIDQTIVDQYVSYLRRKLEPIDSGIAIATVRNVGYVLREAN
jgi:two-component system OmpR family response regulator